MRDRKSGWRRISGLHTQPKPISEIKEDKRVVTLVKEFTLSTGQFTGSIDVVGVDEETSTS